MAISRLLLFLAEAAKSFGNKAFRVKVLAPTSARCGAPATAPDGNAEFPTEERGEA
jgi:hypothetical protein